MVSAVFLALLASLALTRSANALDFDRKKAFVVDRCGGDYSCDDVKLVLIERPDAPATIFDGKQITLKNADGAIRHNGGYLFADGTGTIDVDDAPLSITFRGVKSPLENRPYLTLETPQSYVFLTGADCDDCGTLLAFFLNQKHGKFDMVVVDKKSRKALEKPADIATRCLRCETGPGDTLTACEGEMRISADDVNFIVSGDPCADIPLEMSQTVDGKTSKFSDVEDRPHAF